MERKTVELGGELNGDFRKSLLQWQASPEDMGALEKVRNLIYTASDFGFGLRLKIKGEILSTSESRRAITPTDLKRHARIEGYSFVFDFGPKKSKHAEYTLTAKSLYGQPLLILHSRHEGMIGMFRPHEIASISII